MHGVPHHHHDGDANQVKSQKVKSQKVKTEQVLNI